MIKSILGGKSKNLFDINANSEKGYYDEQGNFYPNDRFLCFTIDVISNNTYCISTSKLGAVKGIVSFWNNNTFVSAANNGEHTAFAYTVPSGANKLKFVIEADQKYSNIQLELGSTATEYVPHELTSYKSIMKVSDVCQLVDKSKFTASGTTSGITWVSNGDGSITLNGTCTDGFALNPFNQQIPVDQTHFYYTSPYLSINYGGRIDGTYETGGIGYIKASAQPTKFNTVFYIWIDKDKSFSNVTTFINIDDLTEIFGAGNEPKTVAEFKAKFPNDYYPYSPSCFVTSFDERMPCKTKNLFDKSKADVISREYYFTLNQSAGSNFYVMTVKPGITYTVTYERFIKSSDVGAYNALELSIQTGTHYTDGTQLLIILGSGERGVWVKRSKQFTVPSGINQVTFSGLKDRFLYRNFMVQEGTTATDYVPYGYV